MIRRLPHSRTIHRRGAVLPLLAVTIVALLGFVALSIDLGLLMVARNNCQNAADSAALAAVRTVNGDSAAGFRRPQVSISGVDAAVTNPVMRSNITGSVGSITSTGTDVWQSGNVKIELGSYTYNFDGNPDNEGFQLRFPKLATDPYGAVRSTVVFDAGRYSFARIFGISTFSTGATATAVHRPRDVVVIMDLSGSMRLQSHAGVAWDGSKSYPSANNRERNKSMNPETVFPKFGHYSDIAGAGLQGTTSYITDNNEFTDPGNISVTTDGGPAVAEYFFTDINSTIRAFSRAPDAYQNTPGGDAPLKSTPAQADPYAKTLREVLNTPVNQTNLAWETNGYTSTALTSPRATFSGYTQGPGYWGKTFFIWPPAPGDATTSLDPTNYANNGAKDWRQRFFIKVPTAASFTGTVEQTAGNIAPNGYTANNTATIRVIGLTGTPEVGDSVTFSNQTSGAYSITGVTPVVSGVCTITLNRKVQSAIADSSLVTASFREVSWVRDNDLLFDASGVLRAPGPFTQSGGTGNTIVIGSGTTQYFYRVNYAAILSWIQNSGPNPFPTSLRAGRLYYYREFPNYTDPYFNQRMWTDDFSSVSADQTQSMQFWRDYIDFVLSIDWTSWSNYSGTSFERYQRFNGSGIDRGGLIGNGVAYQWGATAAKISPAPTVNNTTAYLTAKTSGILNITGSPTLNLTSFSPSMAPRIGDILEITGDNTDYTVSAVISSTVVTVSPTLQATAPNNTAVTFKQIGYMNYDDNPKRFRHQFWFGPMTFMDFIGNYNTGILKWPGNVPEAQSFACKTGIQVALADMRVNCPNDFISTVYFSSANFHNQAKVALRSIGDAGHYNRAVNALWFPPKVYTSATPSTAEIVWNDGDKVPRADGGTSPGYGFMLAYNQLSSSRVSADLRTYALNSSSISSPENGIVGGRGRKGAQKMIIFETDGAPNSNAIATLVPKTSVAADGTLSNDSYFPVRTRNRDGSDGANESADTSSGSLMTNLYTVVDTICNKDAANGGPPAAYGHATNRRPVLIHSIGYGTLFSPTAAGLASQTAGLDAMQTIQFKGSTATTSVGTDFPEYKRIYGTSDQRITKMQQAFTAILQDGVSVTLIR